MPTFREAIATFRAKATAGEIVNRKTGQPGPFAASRVPPILSNVTTAVRRAAASQNGGRHLGETEILELELEPFWTVMPKLAFDDAEENGRSDPAKERANVRLFVSAVTGRDIEHDRQPVVPARVPDAFRPLYDAVVAEHAHHQRLSKATMRSYKRGVLKMAELLLSQGIAGPEGMPTDPELVHQWGKALGWPRKETMYCLTAYRKAAGYAGATHLPLPYDLVDEDGLGIKSLPDYPARLKQAGYTGDPRTAPIQDTVLALAPDLGEPLIKVITAGRTAGMSPAWAEFRERTANWLVAEVLRNASALEINVETLTWLDLWIERREVDVVLDAKQESQLARYRSSRVAKTSRREHRSLMRLLLDAGAPRSYENSNLRLKNPAHEREAVPVYTQQMMQHAKTAWSITKAWFGEAMEHDEPEIWGRATAAFTALQKHIKEYNRPRLLLGRKPKNRLPITYPQSLCMGVPYLARQCYALRGELRDRLVKLGHLESRESQRLLNEYDSALFAWAVFTIPTDDGLRRKNYANASLGAQVRVQYTPEPPGAVTGVARVSTHWSGADGELVALKKTTENDAGTQVVNDRDRDITPAFLDPVLAFDYLTITRPRALVAAGLLERVEDFNPRRDDWPLFITTRPTAEQRAQYHAEQAAYQAAVVEVAEGTSEVTPARPTWRGHMSEDRLSELYGRTMHRICVEVLGRDDLPAFDDPKLAKDWFGIFSIHIFRTEIACYYGGTRNDWDAASDLTNDTLETLKKNYHKVQKDLDAKKHRTDWQNPKWFDAVMDRAAGRHPGDDWVSFWRRFDPMRPHDSLERLVTPTPPPPSRRSRLRA